MDKINDELKKLELEIEDVKRRLQALPDGSLVCSRNGNYWKWYWNNGDNGTIPFIMHCKITRPNLFLMS